MISKITKELLEAKKRNSQAFCGFEKIRERTRSKKRRRDRKPICKKEELEKAIVFKHVQEAITWRVSCKRQL